MIECIVIRFLHYHYHVYITCQSFIVALDTTCDEHILSSNSVLRFDFCCGSLIGVVDLVLENYYILQDSMISMQGYTCHFVEAETTPSPPALVVVVAGSCSHFYALNNLDGSLELHTCF